MLSHGRLIVVEDQQSVMIIKSACAPMLTLATYVAHDFIKGNILSGETHITVTCRSLAS